MAMNSILVVVDHTAEDRAIVEAVGRLATPEHARVTVIQADAPGTLASTISHHNERLHDMLDDYMHLRGVSQALRDLGFAAVAKPIDRSDPERIAEAAEHEDATLIILGASRSQPIGQTLVGHLAEAGKGPPVVLVPPRHEQRIRQVPS
jgi:K+-sensing histidine kinase KdpD